MLSEEQLGGNNELLRKHQNLTKDCLMRYSAVVKSCIFYFIFVKKIYTCRLKPV